ncbi:MAG: hypothetical protein VYA86_05215 [Candidatus Thermoplasmatota archaeon]|nr:hypothetical protein [Candidatus Thermoplasmatota archaeon]
MTCGILTLLVTMRRDDGGVNLPRPYGEGFDLDDGLEELIDSRLARMETQRRFWGRLSNNWLWTLLRTLIPPSLVIITVAVMALPEKFNPTLVASISVVLTIIFVAPSAITRNLALWVGVGRFGARGRTQDERDGSIERILNTLTELRLHEHMRIGYLLTYSFLLWLSDRFPIGTETRGLLLVTSILAASIALVQTILLERRTPGHSNDLPFLVYHAPSQHKSTLENPLTQILVAHLDPESTTRFQNWRDSLVLTDQPNKTANQIVEKILHLVYLRGQNMLTQSQLLQEFEKLVGTEGVDESILNNPHLDLPTLSRLVGHTRAWQSDLFRQMDRLQFGLMDHNESIVGSSWRLDASLPLHCAESRGDLFVMVNNLGKERVPVELEVHVPDGQPSRQTFRLTPEPKTPPNHPLPMWSNDEEDVVTWLTELVDSAQVMWLSLAWAEDIEGRRPVRITIRHIDGHTIGSDTLWTKVSVRSSGGDTLRRRMGSARATARRWQNQALNHTDPTNFIAP